MNSMMKIPVAVSYGRVSTAMQMMGDGVRRQDDLAEKWCAKRGIPLLAENILKDEGVSAFRGKNIKQGALGKFLELAQAGKFAVGSWLLVESIDRLSRQEPLKTLATVIFQLLEAGIIIVTLNDDKEYKHPIDPSDVFLLVAVAIRANEESETKRKRNVAAWKHKREVARAGGKKLTSISPAWLTPWENRMGFDVIPERVEIVKRIFRMSGDGMGIHVITKTLNREGIPAFGRASSWHIHTVNTILKNRAVIGEFQMKVRTHGEGGKGKANDGEIVKGYYPAIMTEADFFGSMANRARRKGEARGRKGVKFSNLFTGLAFCSECGGKMHMRQYSTYRGKNEETNKRNRESKILFCSETLNGMCRQKAWKYQEFEKSFLSFVREVDLETVIKGGTGSRIETINGTLQQLDGEKQDIDSKVEKLIEFDDDIPMVAIKAKLAKLQVRLDEIAALVERLNQERVEILESRRSSAIVDFNGFPDNLSDAELYLVRNKAAEHIRGVVESIHMERLVRVTDTKTYTDAHYLVRFKGGASRVIYPDNSDAENAYSVMDFDFVAGQKNWPASQRIGVTG